MANITWRPNRLPITLFLIAYLCLHHLSFFFLLLLLLFSLSWLNNRFNILFWPYHLPRNKFTISIFLKHSILFVHNLILFNWLHLINFRLQMLINLLFLIMKVFLGWCLFSYLRNWLLYFCFIPSLKPFLLLLIISYHRVIQNVNFLCITHLFGFEGFYRQIIFEIFRHESCWSFCYGCECRLLRKLNFWNDFDSFAVNVNFPLYCHISNVFAFHLRFFLFFRRSFLAVICRHYLIITLEKAKLVFLWVLGCCFVLVVADLLV